MGLLLIIHQEAHTISVLTKVQVILTQMETQLPLSLMFVVIGFLTVHFVIHNQQLFHLGGFQVYLLSDDKILHAALNHADVAYPQESCGFVVFVQFFSQPDNVIRFG